MAERLLGLLGRLHILLKNTTHEDTHSMGVEMSCALSLLQGMCLTHGASKQLCSSRSSLELFLAILGADYSQATDTQSSLHLLASHAIDTLMCVLVDASPDTRRLFEQAHGLRIARRVMNAHTGLSQQDDQDLTGS